MFESMVLDPPGEAEDWLPSNWHEQLEEPPEEPQYSPAHATPSGWLAVELQATTEQLERLDDAALVDAIVGFERVLAWAGARQARLLAEFTRRRPGDDRHAVGSDKASMMSRYAPDEIGVALSLSRGTAASRLAQAKHLESVLPHTLQAWEQGRLDAVKVRAISETTLILEPERARAVQDRVLPRAPRQTPAQLRAALARAVLAADPDGAAARHRTARTGRRVALGDDNDGMASLWALLPAPDATSAYQWLTRLARGLGAHDPRGMDARRADLLVELLTGQLTITHPDSTPTPDGGGDAPGPPGQQRPMPAPVAPGKPLIQIVMPYTTLTGVDDQPCELVGYGPVPADLAREIAADAVWKRLVTDPLTGTLLDHGRTTYHPPTALADHVRARNLTCRFPTCRRRALDTELDHARPWSTGGTTSDHNLWAGCTHHHHHLKHSPGWTVTLHPDGRLIWTTPTGHTYHSEPHDYCDRPPPPADPASPPPGPSERHGPVPTDWHSARGACSASAPGSAETARPDDPPPF